MAEHERKRRANDEAAENSAHKSKGLIGRITGYFNSEQEEEKAEIEVSATGGGTIADGVFMLAHNLSIELTPMAFQLLHAHISGERPDVTNVVEHLRQEGKPVSTETIAQLHERFFGAELESQAVYEASRNVERLLSIVQDELGNASDHTAKHGKAITALNDQLSQQEKIADIRRVVSAIVEETASMRMSINKLERRVIQGTTEIAILRDNLTKAQREANSDPLTGIGNRKLLEMTLRRLAKDAGGKDEQPFCLLLLDIDHFKRFNDDYGHQTGDLVLKQVAHTVFQSIKARDLAARYGGEELAVVLVDTLQGQAVRFAESLRSGIEALRLKAEDVEQEVRPITVSIGIAEFRKGEPLKRLVGRADRALYQAKGQGRNCVCSERDIEVHGRPKVKA